VTPSEWLAEEARRSSLLKDAPIDVIPNGVDPEVFRPRETKGLRKVLDIPPGDRVILFVATSTQVRRKGFDLLAGALNEMEEDSVTLISIGSHEPDLDGVKSHIHLGAVQSDLLLSLFYSLADVFVIPSRQDNLPNTVLESMACGTPVVGYDVGGVSDMVRPQETGWLAETDDVEELSASIRRALLEDATRKQKGKACREVFEEEYTLAKQAERYSRLYESMLRG
jgi:glycosyltransferase involved in cell wall biosynthesis